MKKANEHEIPYGLMEDLNYTDLQAMIIEYDIDILERMKREKERERLASKGVERRKATAEDFDRL